MGSINIEDLFDYSRFPGGVGTVLLCLYLPLGIALAIVRVFIGLHAYLIALLLPKTSTIRRFVLRVMCMVLGIFVTRDKASKKEDGTKILVANYTSVLDHLAVELILPNIIPNVWGLSSSLAKLLGYVDMGASQGKDTLLKNAKKHCHTSRTPLLTFPEGSTTNGKSGLLKFSTWPFSLDQPVQPILIRIRRPAFANAPVSILGGRWLFDVLWFLMVPYTHFHIRMYQSNQRHENEAVEDFGNRIQELLAKENDVTPTRFTSADKKDYVKKKKYMQQNEVVRTNQSVGIAQEVPDTPLHEMTRQVQNVLPQVPYNVIYADLEKTNDIDITISNILEGKVTYTLDNMHNNTKSSSVTPPLTKSKSFGKTSSERHLSFSERKELLIENARRKYMEKHGML